MYGEYSEKYSKWCSYYDSKNVEMDTIQKYISIKNKDVVDIGCGTGRLLFRMLPDVKTIIGIDNDEDSIRVLNEILAQKYAFYKPKTKIINSGIEDAYVGAESIDVAFFSWSLYALDKNHMKQAIRNVLKMLRDNGKLVILQPIGGEFESVMRLFFKDHTDKDEYKTCMNNMNELIPPYFELFVEDKIISDFIVPTLEEFCEMLKMFAVTEGGCNYKELEYIRAEILKEPMKRYRTLNGYCLSDEVSLFIYTKKKL